MAIRSNFKRSRLNRNDRHRAHNYNRFRDKYLIGLLTVIVFCIPAKADINQADDTNVSATPQAAITGSVANQAVQINQGSLSTQSFKQGHFCNGPVLSFAPYLLQTENPGSISRNLGGQISLSVPLDGGSVELCKELGRISVQKQRLDYELIRIKECINIYKEGFTIRPGTPFYRICEDVVPLASAPKSKVPSSLESSQASSSQTLSKASKSESSVEK